MVVELSRETRDTLERHNLSPLWEVEEDHLGETRPDLEAAVWKWEHMEEAIRRIEDDVAIEDLPPGFRRRVTVPVNVGYGAAISYTIYVGVQTVSPGEEAVAHRHGANALRFAIDGHEDMKTAVGGEEFPMLDHDLVTTPQWEWHGHINDSDEEVAWLDVLDLPLVLDALNIGTEFEEHQDGRQTIDKPMGYYAAAYGDTRVAGQDDSEIPGPFNGFRTPTPPYRFQWGTITGALEFAADQRENYDPYDGVAVEYVNPRRGAGPLFPTFDVRAQRIENGEATQAHQHNATEVYYVIEGRGETKVSEDALTWEARDIFVVPPNLSHFHNPDGDATFLVLSDRAVLEAINFYHETDSA